MDIHVHFSVCIPRSGIAGSCGNSTFNFWEELQDCFAALHFIFPPAVSKGSSFPTTLTICLSDILVCVKRYLIVALIFISLMGMVNVVEHFFMCLLALYRNASW